MLKAGDGGRGREPFSHLRIMNSAAQCQRGPEQRVGKFGIMPVARRRFYVSRWTRADTKELPGLRQSVLRHIGLGLAAGLF